MRTAEARRRGGTILFIATHPMTVRLLMRGQLGYLKSQGFEVAVAAGPGPDLEAAGAAEGVRVFPVPMVREISPFGDLRALVRLTRVISELRPQIVNAGTPKAGLLGMMASCIKGVPLRYYTARGLRLERASGWRRRLLWMAEKVAVSCASRVVYVSPSLLRRCAEIGLASPRKSLILGAGSSNGVDVARFHPSNPGDPEILGLKARWGIPPEAPVIGFVGRLTRDKGVEDLAEIFFNSILSRYPEAYLLLVGAFESDDPVSAQTRFQLQQNGRVILPGHVEDSTIFYRLMDVLAFPSYREGFPNVPLEAAASGVPVVGYAATGTVDAVRDGVTGRLVPVGCRSLLASRLLEYLGDRVLRSEHGSAGRGWVTANFESRAVWELWAAEYRLGLKPRRRGGAKDVQKVR